MTDARADTPDARPADASVQRLLVRGARGPDADRALARLPRAAMAALGLRPGDVVAIRAGASAPVAYARAFPAADLTDAVALDAAQRGDAGLALGDAAEVSRAGAAPTATAARLRPDEPVDPDALRAALEEHPLAPGRRFGVRLASGRRVEGAVLAVEPAAPARVTAATRLSCDDRAPAAAYGGAAGLDAQVARVREMVELPLRRPDLFARLGVSPPRGVLFTGPPGSGKTLLARAVAQQNDAAFFQIDGPEILCKHYGDSEAKLREVFAAAQRRAPAVVFIDEIDAIAPRRGDLSGEKQLERRLVAQLLTLMDGLSDRGQVVVMAATNMPDALDPALRRPGRFDREIAFGAPDRAARRAILGLHCAPLPLAGDVDLDALAERTAGHVGADLAAVAREAALAAVARAAAAAGGIDAVAAPGLHVGASDFETALAAVGPSVLRSASTEMDVARWSDVGGLDEAKQTLTEAVIWPLRHAAAFRNLGLKPARGVLLAGPPGGGKTLLARALAAESGAHFIAARGAHLLSRWLGDAERAIAELFAQARQAAPCVLFFDEIDAIAPARGSADPALTRVVAQLLVEIDGLASAPGLFVLGATNRVEAIDPALLRPGRFDEIVRIGPPDARGRAEILAVHVRDMPLEPSVDLEALATLTAGWSGAELRALCQNAAAIALRRWVRAGAQEATQDATQGGAHVGASSGPTVAPTDFAMARAQRQRSDAARRGADD